MGARLERLASRALQGRRIEFPNNDEKIDPRDSESVAGVIEITDEMRERIGTALTDGMPIIAASVEPDGQPKISFYGSAHVYSRDQIALWHRDPEGGLVSRLPHNPRIALVYRNQKDRITWQFYGRAQIVDDRRTREAVYENIPDLEKMFDVEKRGRVIIIDVDRVVGRGIDMRRDPGRESIPS